MAFVENPKETGNVEAATRSIAERSSDSRLSMNWRSNSVEKPTVAADVVAVRP
jgi:hypothetical protein